MKAKKIIEEMGKTLRTSAGSFELLTPRDREGSFEPQIAKKRQISLHPELEAKVLSTYARPIDPKETCSHACWFWLLETSILS
ncbi:Transposase, Mutator family [Wolbachia endosymbiont of Armadillidium vulgare]|nr:Transposase, Mutator family [Wolbachia endosymbiont of Armadillidium vulgare]OJH32248.1 Transposase, Mutator family [Wolbachia endosymbiont of Armadillidium vulgare]OJH32955.1 Transposase, Mutator family [Wolbachia endosymbiont of Armadillidium vulgare]